MTKRFIGIDLSSHTGFVIQSEDRLILHEQEISYPTDKDPERMVFICQSIFSHLNKETDIIAIENPSYGSKGRAVSFQAGLNWTLRNMLHTAGFSYYDVAPTQLKKFATSNHAADKPVIATVVKKRWGFFHGSDNITDAFVLSEIARALTDYPDYEDMKKHEKEVILALRKGRLNNKKEKEIKRQPWTNPRSKYYFVRDPKDLDYSKNKK